MSLQDYRGRPSLALELYPQAYLSSLQAKNRLGTIERRYVSQLRAYTVQLFLRGTGSAAGRLVLSLSREKVEFIR